MKLIFSKSDFRTAFLACSVKVYLEEPGRKKVIKTVFLDFSVAFNTSVLQTPLLGLQGIVSLS